MESGSGVNGPPLTKEEQQTLNNNIKATTKLTSATVTMLAGGKAKDITTSSNVGESAIKNNYVQHIFNAARTLGIAVGALSAEEVAVVGGAAVVGTAISTQSEMHEDSDNRILSTPLPEIQKPITLSTPVIERGATILSTPEQEPKSWQRLPGYEAYDGPDTSVLFSQKLLPNEGKVGSYGELTDKSISKPGDNLTAHHIPSAGYMKQFNVKRQDGVSILVEHPHPGAGGRHSKTDTYGKKTNLDLEARQELAKDILDLRNIYIKDGVYTPEIRQGLQEVVKQNKEKFPKIYKKE